MNVSGGAQQDTIDDLREVFQFENYLKSETFEHAPDAMLVADDASLIVMANERAESMFGWSRLNSGSIDLRDVFPDWSNVIVPHLSDKEATVSDQKIKALSSNGREMTFFISVAGLKIGNRRMLIISLRDALPEQFEKYVPETTYQELLRDKEQLESLVKMDALTNVLNRRGLESVLAREIDYAKRNKTDLLAVLIDLDDFKRVNDTQGHFVGDLVLKHVASVLTTSVRSIDWLGRVGGDEFLILLPDTSLMSGVKVAERIRAELSEKAVPSADVEIRQTASFGIVKLPINVCSVEEVLELTTSTLKDSKRRGKNCVSFSGLHTNASTTKNTRSENMREVLLNYCDCRTVIQPIFSFDTKNVIGFEVLTRGPSKELEMPDAYFRACREHNLLTIADLQCLKAAVQRAKELPLDQVCHINLFPSTLAEVPAEKIVEQLALAGESRKFCIELSEKQIKSDPDYLLEPLAVLRQNHILIALDDVGYGHSSLEAVFDLMPDVIKLDARLTKAIAHERRNQLIVNKLKKLADLLESILVAEAVESEEDMTALRRLGVEYGQGWFFAQPE